MLMVVCTCHWLLKGSYKQMTFLTTLDALWSNCNLWVDFDFPGAIEDSSLFAFVVLLQVICCVIRNGH